ncbi:MAG TPA: hypothetical protein V6D19_22005 [Stenomitos sp.]
MKRPPLRFTRPSCDRTLFRLVLHLQGASKQEGGYIIVIVAGLLLAMTTMLLTAQLASRVDSSSTKASGNSAAGFYAAEAGLNLRAKSIRAKFQGYNLPTGTSPSDWSVCRAGAGGTGDFACDNTLTIQDYLYPNDSSKRIPVSTYVVDQNPRDGSGVSQPTSVTIGSGEQFAGLTAQEYRYDVTSVAFDRATRQPNALLGIRFKSRLVPLFQFAVFYQQDLDFSNPPNMTMNGPIHSNGNLYFNAAGSSTLSINGTVSTSGRFFRGERLNSGCSGTVNIFSPIPSPGGYQSVACNSSSRKEYFQADVTPTWGPNQIKIGIPTLTVPTVESLNADSSGDYWSKAQLRIVLKLDSSERPTGIEVQTASGGTDSASTNKLLGSVCAPTSTTLSASEAVTDTTLSVASSTNLAGSALQLEPSGTSNYVSNTAIDNDANVVVGTTSTSLTIRKQLTGAPPSPATFPSGTVVRKAAVWTSNTFWNYREKYAPSTPQANDAKPIRLLNVDMRALMTCANQLMGGKNLDDTQNGGLVWFFTVKGPNSNNDVTSGGSSNTYGIRLYNGGTLGSANVGDPAIKGLTVVSDQAIYLRGDYNSVNKKPAAILGDTINVLSNAWPLDDTYSAMYDANGLQDANSDQRPDSPVYIYSFDTGIPTGSAPPAGQRLRLASSTTINAAFLAGIDLTGGGVNNYPRFQEDWFNPDTNARATLTYRGSMVSLGLPRRVNGPFCGSGTSNGTGGCNIYTPPFRNWDYDTDFNNAANLPPLSPRFVYLRQERFTRSYDRQAFLTAPNPIQSILPSRLFGTMPFSGF